VPLIDIDLIFLGEAAAAPPAQAESEK